jgi:hypothetical protein
VPVAQGLTRAILHGAHPAGQTPDDKPERVSFVLRPRNLAGLEAQVAASMPGGPLTASQFAASYGQPPANVAALRRYLSQFGIHTDAYRDGLDVRATGTVGQFNDALTIQQDSFRLPAAKGQHGVPGRPAMTVHSPRSAPLLPVSLARFVLAVFGLTTYPPGTSNAVHRPALATGAQPAATQKGDLTPAAATTWRRCTARASPAAARPSASSPWPACARRTRNSSGTTRCTSPPRRAGSGWSAWTAGPGR